MRTLEIDCFLKNSGKRYLVWVGLGKKVWRVPHAVFILQVVVPQWRKNYFTPPPPTPPWWVIDINGLGSETICLDHWISTLSQPQSELETTRKISWSMKLHSFGNSLRIMFSVAGTYLNEITYTKNNLIVLIMTLNAIKEQDKKKCQVVLTTV